MRSMCLMASSECQILAEKWGGRLGLKDLSDEV